jgi:hypothetical protein
VQVAEELMSKLSTQKPADWVAFQNRVQQLKLRRSELARDAEEQAATAAANSVQDAYELGSDHEEDGAADRAAAAFAGQGRLAPVRIVLITGFESFNQQLYKKAAQQVSIRPPCGFSTADTAVACMA